MAYTLPTCPPALDYDIYPDTLRANNSPIMGGPDTRVARLGTRHICDVSLDSMTAQQALTWRNRLQNEDQTVVWEVPTKGLTVGNPGTPVVDGDDQSGSVLNVRGLTPGYVIQEDQPLPIRTTKNEKVGDSVSAVQRIYFYKARSSVVADENGDAAVPINVILRVSPDDGDTILMASPVIEGFVVQVSGLKVQGRRLGRTGLVEGVRFTLKERR